MFDKLFFTKNGQISESLALGIFLTLAGGFQDAYSYNVRDHVFANAQTGNIVLLGQNLASGNLMHALRYLLPLAAFFLGVYLTEWIKHFYKTSVKIHWRQIVLIIEILILGITGFLPNEPTLNVIANSMCNDHVHRKYAKCDRISLPVPYQQRSGDEIQKHALWIYYSGFCDRCRFRCLLLRLVWRKGDLDRHGHAGSRILYDVCTSGYRSIREIRRRRKRKDPPDTRQKKINMKLCLLLTCIYVYYLLPRKKELPTAVPFSFSNFLPSRYFILREADSAHRSSSVLLL